MVIAFFRSLEDDPRLLQKIPLDVSSSDVAGVIKFNTNEFSLGSVRVDIGFGYKTGRVIIPHSLGVAKRLKYGICFEYLLFEIVGFPGTGGDGS
jgi:hypothetical protein